MYENVMSIIGNYKYENVMSIIGNLVVVFTKIILLVNSSRLSAAHPIRMVPTLMWSTRWVSIQLHSYSICIGIHNPILNIRKGTYL